MRGREEGSKDRPCVVILAVRRQGDELVVSVAPVTHTPPPTGSGAVEIPAATKQRLGLDTQRSWIITHEVNRFVWPGPDIRPLPSGGFAYGLLPRGLYNPVKAAVLEHVRRRTINQVGRDQPIP
jgi:hypothetical protein